jgi:arylsulfatase A-like enzyme
LVKRYGALMICVPKGIGALPAGTSAGSVCDRPVDLSALFPTLTALCGLPEKADVTGHNLIPLLRDPSVAWPHCAMTQLDQPDSYAISTERWRYIHYQGGDEELYDIVSDPYEWTNLAPKAEHAAKLSELRALAPKEKKILPAAK